METGDTASSIGVFVVLGVLAVTAPGGAERVATFSEMRGRVATILAAVLAGCGGGGSPHTATRGEPARRAGAQTLPIDDQRTPPLKSGIWQTQPGSPLHVTWRIPGPGWFGAHRSVDLSWQLRYGPTIGPDQLADLFEVDLESDGPSSVISALRHERGVAVGRIGHETLGGRPATTVDMSFTRKVSLKMIGGFNVDKGETARFHLVPLGQQTLVIDQDAPNRGRFRRFQAPAAKVLESMRIQVPSR